MLLQVQAFALIRRKQTYEGKIVPNIGDTALLYQNDTRLEAQ